MNFSTFKEKIPTLETTQLGGIDSQFKLAPALRKRFDEAMILSKNPRKASVLALFYPNKNKQSSLLLTQRATYNGAHSAQISLPGGKIEKYETAEQGALRETFEETGVQPSSIKIVREISEAFIPPSNFIVTPFLGYTNFTPKFTINHEVDEVIEILVSDLLNDNNLTSVEIATSYMKKTKVPCFKLNNKIVWGATAMILSEIKDLFNS